MCEVIERQKSVEFDLTEMCLKVIFERVFTLQDDFYLFLAA